METKQRKERKKELTPRNPLYNGLTEEQKKKRLKQNIIKKRVNYITQKERELNDLT